MSVSALLAQYSILDYGKAVGIPLLICYAIQELRVRRRLCLVPTPPGASSIFGHEKAVFFNSTGEKYFEWFQLLGPIYRIKSALTKPDVLVVGDPLALAHILHNIYDYPHSPIVQDRIGRIVGKSLGWCEGETPHRSMRALLAPSMTVETVRAGAHNVFDAASTMHDALAENIQNSVNPVELNIMDYINAATLDVIGRYAFAHDFSGGRDKDAQSIMYTWQKMGMVSSSPKGFNAIMMLRLFSFVNHLPLKAIKAQSEVRMHLHAGIANELLRREETKGKGGDGNDLLSLLMRAYHQNEISREELMDHIATFVIGGFETTAQAIGFALWQLSKNPDMQEKLREEVSGHAQATFDDYQSKMPYLDAVTRETLRLCSPLPYHERIAAVDDVLPLRHPLELADGTITTELPIYKGQAVQIPMVSINRLGWPDGDLFRPERWSEPLPPTDLLPRGWSHTLVFGDGPRTCIGYRLAIFEMKVMIATLLRSFAFLDAGKIIDFKVAANSSAYVRGEEDKGPQLPIFVHIL